VATLCETMDMDSVAVYYLLIVPTTYLQRDGQAELTWMADYIPRWFACQQTFTHPNTNQAWFTTSQLIEAKVTTKPLLWLTVKL